MESSQIKLDVKHDYSGCAFSLPTTDLQRDSRDDNGKNHRLHVARGVTCSKTNMYMMGCYFSYGTTTP